MMYDDMMVFGDDNILQGAATNLFLRVGGCAATRSFGRELADPVQVYTSLLIYPL